MQPASEFGTPTSAQAGGVISPVVGSPPVYSSLPTELGPPPPGGQLGPPPPTISVAPGSADSDTQVSLLLKELQLQRDERAVQDLNLQEQAIQHREEAAVQAAQHREQVAAAAAAQTALTNSVALLTTKLLDQEKAIADFTSEKKSEKEEEKEVPYVPHRFKENQHPERPKFQKNNEPQLYVVLSGKYACTVQ